MLEHFSRIASLANLYDPLTIPQNSAKLMQSMNRAVMQAYRMPIKETDEAASVAWLKAHKTVSGTSCGVGAQ